MFSLNVAAASPVLLSVSLSLLRCKCSQYPFLSTAGFDECPIFIDVRDVLNM